MCVNPLNRFELPIILVPGIMGSRLHVAGDPDAPIWDPDNTLAMLRLADMYTSYRADWLGVRHRGEVFKSARDAESITKAQKKRGWGGVAWGFYGEGLKDLERASATLGGIVYAFGYDWRQSNWLSGALLKQKIRQIRTKHENRKVLVVTHSMGGLVTRAAATQGAEEDILGVVHTMQPANGTPLAYRQCKTGGAALHWVLADVVLGRIIGRTPVQYAAMSSGMRGAFELLPNDTHTRATGNEPSERPGIAAAPRAWLTIDGNMQSGLPARYTMYDAYLEDTGKVGLIDYAWYRSRKLVHINEAYVLDDWVSGPDIARGVKLGVEGAGRFHQQRLGNYVHPNTSVVAGNGLESDVALHLNRDTHWFSEDTTSPSMVRERYGDGTVSLSSATSLRLNGKAALAISDSDRQTFINNVQHAAAFGTSAPFRELVWKMCEQVLQCADSLT
jgi:hypothetical protein